MHIRLLEVLIVLGLAGGVLIGTVPASTTTYIIDIAASSSAIATTTATWQKELPDSLSKTTVSAIAPIELDRPVQAAVATTAAPQPAPANTPGLPYHEVPFYSQFTDITPVNWRAVGCGIASVAMLIDFYSEEVVSVDALLQQGIAANAYLDSAGWTHAGLINLATQYQLEGRSQAMSHLSMSAAFAQLQTVVREGPVMVSVHYTFQPTNPIPHLAVVTGIDQTRVYYNDPAEPNGQNNISIAQFKRAWKKRYIEIRPTV